MWLQKLLRLPSCERVGREEREEEEEEEEGYEEEVIHA